MKYSRSIRVAALLALTCVTGCGYGEVSPETYQYAQSLYAISNRRSADRLADFLTQLDEAVNTGNLADSEAQLLRDIAGMAQEGDWKSAQLECRELMEAQVK